MNNHFLEGYPFLIPACATLLEFKGFGPGLLKFTFKLKTSYAACIGLSPANLAQFTLEMHVAARNRDIFTKTPIFWVQGHSRSSSPVLVMISSMYLLICNHFHLERANSGKITPF